MYVKGFTPCSCDHQAKLRKERTNQLKIGSLYAYINTGKLPIYTCNENIGVYECVMTADRIHMEVKQ